MVTIPELLSKPDLNTSDLNKLKLVELKKICKEKGLSVAGTKSELISRFLQSQNPNADSTVSDVPDAVEEELLGSPEHSENEPITEEIEPSKADMKAEADDSCEPPEKKQKFTKIEAPVSAESQEQMRISDRMKRFGVVSEENKKQARATRFQTSTKADAPIFGDDLLKKRAERFNLTATTASSPSTTTNDDIIKKRLARFDGVKQPSTDPINSTSALTKRQARFGQVASSTTDDVKQKRAERFGLK